MKTINVRDYVYEYSKTLNVRENSSASISFLLKNVQGEINDPVTLMNFWGRVASRPPFKRKHK